MGDEQCRSYLEKMKRFRKLHDEMQNLDGVLNQLYQKTGSLDDAEICLSVGTGWGEYDIRFVQRFMPNLKKFIAVEMDHCSVEELKRNLENTFGNKLQVEIYEMLIEDFQKNTKENNVLKREADVVLCCHSLYNLDPNGRLEFFKSCTDSWLKPETGKIVICSSVHNDNDVARLHEKVKNKSHTTMDVLEDELKLFGWKTFQEIRYETTFDVSDSHEAYEGMFMHSDQVEEKVFKKYLEELARDGTLIQRSKLSIFERLVL